jgi:uncharacterized membrane protein
MTALRGALREARSDGVLAAVRTRLRPDRRRPAAWLSLADVALGAGAIGMTLRARAGRRSLLAAGLDDASHRLRGLAARVTRRVQPRPVPDAVLEERVRSTLGRAGGHTGVVDVRAGRGVVVLSGSVLANEVDGVRNAVRGTPGVRAVEEQLHVRSDPGHISALQGAPAPPAGAGREGWPPALRLGAIAAGWAASSGALALGARLGRPLLALPGLVVGLVLALRGATNLTFGRLLGIGGDRRGIDVEKAIEVAAPVEASFLLWDRVEEFPWFMDHVDDVWRNPDGTTGWQVAGPARLPVGFRADTTQRVPNELIAWQTVDGERIRHAGVVRFEPRPADRSRVTIRMSYNPPGGLLGHAIARLFRCDPKRALDDDMIRFQSLLVTGKTTAHGEERTIGEIAAEAAAWSPIAAGAGMSPAGVTSDSVAAFRREPAEREG